MGLAIRVPRSRVLGRPAHRTHRAPSPARGQHPASRAPGRPRSRNRQDRHPAHPAPLVDSIASGSLTPAGQPAAVCLAAEAARLATHLLEDGADICWPPQASATLRAAGRWLSRVARLHRAGAPRILRRQHHHDLLTRAAPRPLASPISMTRFALRVPHARDLPRALPGLRCSHLLNRPGLTVRSPLDR